MGTEFNFNSQVCTTKVQSERLLALGIKKETADCGHFYERDEYDEGYYWETRFVGEKWESYWDVTDEEIPAWSLGRLVEIINKCTFESFESETWRKKVKEFWRCIKNDGTIEFKVAVEYDLITKHYTGKEYYENEKFRDRHYTPMHQYKIPMYVRELVPVVPMEPPKGDILPYMMSKNI